MQLVVRSMIVSLHVTHFSDPGCPWAWSASPALAALKWRYGDQLDWRNVMIGLTENGAVYEQRGYTGPGQARGYRTLPRARDAVRHRAAREGPRHVADVPRGRRHPPARPRARVRGLPRAAVRPVHDDRLPRGRRRSCARRSSGCPASTPTRSSPRPRTRRPRRPSSATATRPAPRPNSPDRVPGQARQHRRPRALHGAEREVQEPPGRDARGRRLPVLRGLRRADRQPRPDALAPRARRGRARRSCRPSRTA